MPKVISDKELDRRHPQILGEQNIIPEDPTVEAQVARD